MSIHLRRFKDGAVFEIRVWHDANGRLEVMARSHEPGTPTGGYLPPVDGEDDAVEGIVKFIATHHGEVQPWDPN